MVLLPGGGNWKLILVLLIVVWISRGCPGAAGVC